MRWARGQARSVYACALSCAVWAFLLAPQVSSIAFGATLGTVKFDNSCNPEAGSELNQAIALLHSFEFKEAEAIFDRVERDDPRCGIAAWGLALAKTEWSGANAPQSTLRDGWEQLRPWLSMYAGTQREQMYLNAVRGMYEGYSDVAGSVRWRRYLGRMDAIRRRYPSDSDASLFYALGLVWTAGEGRLGIAQRRRALQILLPIFQKFPDRAGAAHYVIHAADTPELAAIGLPAARQYARIAPDSPHAIHMPSHIFSRLGYWDELIESNEKSARVAAQWVKSGRNGLGDEIHALNYLEYGYLQLDRRDKAREQISRIQKAASGAGGDPWAEIDARISYDVETEDWRDALKLEPPAGSPAQENFDIFWVHAMAAANLGELEIARDALQKLSESISRQRPGINYANILHIYLLQAQAAVSEAQGRHAAAVHTLTIAISYEEAHPVDYPNILASPSAEVLGRLFLRPRNLPSAHEAFREALTMAPNRRRSLEGLSASR